MSRNSSVSNDLSSLTCETFSRDSYKIIQMWNSSSCHVSLSYPIGRLSLWWWWWWWCFEDSLCPSWADLSTLSFSSLLSLVKHDSDLGLGNRFVVLISILPNWWRSIPPLKNNIKSNLGILYPMSIVPLAKCKLPLFKEELEELSTPCSSMFTAMVAALWRGFLAGSCSGVSNSDSVSDCCWANADTENGYHWIALEYDWEWTINMEVPKALTSWAASGEKTSLSLSDPWDPFLGRPGSFLPILFNLSAATDSMVLLISCNKVSLC